MKDNPLVRLLTATGIREIPFNEAKNRYINQYGGDDYDFCVALAQTTYLYMKGVPINKEGSAWTAEDCIRLGKDLLVPLYLQSDAWDMVRADTDMVETRIEKPKDL